VDCWIAFIGHLCTPLGTTSNYSAVANLHTLKITAAPIKTLRACRVFNSCTLSAASNTGDTSSSRAHTVTLRRISRNWTLVDLTIAPSLLSLPCRALLICQPSTELTSWIDSKGSCDKSQSYITTDGHSASLSWNKAPVWGLQPDLYYCETVAGLFVWGALSDERTGLSFTFAAGPRQRSHFRVPVPWDSWQYFTVSDSRLSFPSPPTTRRTTVEVFDPASTRDLCDKVKVMLRPTVQSASPSWNKSHFWGLRPDLYYCQTVAGLLIWVALSDERTGLSFARHSQQ
jgi:hypothetical protein